MRDLYAVLGLRDDATEDAIKTVYRQLARTFHPDVNQDPAAVEHFREITDAYVVLSDPELRRQYDRQRARGPRRRPRGEETETRIGLHLAGIDLGGLLGVTVQVRRRPLFDEDPQPVSEPPARKAPRLPSRRRR
jgi:curved DNA-binding protein CbpA